ncbi:hypothetical protein HOY82DRAFT_537661 [Tuber indicum]|nr:hypothetical protein HOY82DRAFT_537661 [Tuber indicum]
MNRIQKENTREENGQRAEAESLHLLFNKQLSCPGCGASDTVRGAFIKDSAGKKDEHGRRYRRFVCRITSSCKKSIGVTEFLQICRPVMETSTLLSTPTVVASDQGTPNISPGIRHTEWNNFISADAEYKKVEEKAKKELWDEIFILYNELHQARQEILDLKYRLSEIHPTSNDDTNTSATTRHILNEANTNPNCSRSPATSSSTLQLLNVDTTAVNPNRSPLPIKPHAKLTYSSVLRQGICSLSAHYKQVNLIPIPDKGDINITEEGGQHRTKSFQRKRSTTSTPLYLEGIPHIPIVEIKELLKAAPIRIQLRHIRNISWIDRRIVELLVDTNHLLHIRNRLENHSKYKVNRSFDPLKPSSFNWEGDPLPESQEAVLKRNFVERLAASIASSTNHATRQHVMSWSQNRGLGTQLKDQLNKRAIQISQSPSNNIAVTPAVNTTCHEASQNSSFTSPDTLAYQTISSRKRRLSLTDDFTP